MATLELLDRMFDRAVEDRDFPSAVCVIGDADGVYYRKAFGYSRVFSILALLDARPQSIPVDAVRAGQDTLSIWLPFQTACQRQ